MRLMVVYQQAVLSQHDLGKEAMQYTRCSGLPLPRNPHSIEIFHPVSLQAYAQTSFRCSTLALSLQHERERKR